MRLIRNNFFLFLTLCILNIFTFISSSNVGFFDAALFQLQLEYPSKGLMPFIDFVTFYPFGLSIFSILVGKILWIGFSTVFLIWLIHFYLQYIFLKKIKLFIGPKLIPVVFLFLTIETICYARLGTEPLSFLITLILLCEILRDIKNSRIGWPLLFWSTFLVFIRWDSLVYCSFVTLGYIVYFILKKAKLQYLIFIKILSVFFLSFIFLFLALYFYSSSEFVNEINYIFVAPFLIGKFRQLHFYLDPQIFTLYNFYYLLLSLYASVGVWILFVKSDERLGYFYLVGLSFLPYTYSRPDLAHFLPFYLTTLLFSIFICANLGSININYKVINKCVFILIAIATVSFATFSIRSHQPLNTCIVDSGKLGFKPKSIFVGNSNYADFVINLPILYLTNINLKPASKFISDEPGLQNTCRIQKQIINDLVKSSQPTIFYLNKTHLEDKNNTNTFTSCGLLEEYFRVNTTSVGECKLSSNLLDIRVSK